MSAISINPATGEELKKHQSATVDEIQSKVARARIAQQEWRMLPSDQRFARFDALSATLQSNADSLLELIHIEGGKLIPDAQAEVYDVIDAIGYYRKQMEAIRQNQDFEFNTELYPETEVRIDYEPYGVIALIMPWNFPFYSPSMFMIAAVMAGNAVILKPSEYTSLIGLEIHKLFSSAGFPDGLVSVVIGAEDIGQALVKADVDKIFFVGSVEAGQDVIRNAGIKPVQVELGGNSAAIVLDDANIELAANAIAWGGTYHSGQDCAAIKRVFVHESISEEFLRTLQQIVAGLRPGIDYGPYIREDALTQVERRIQDAIKHGAKLLCGAKRLSMADKQGFWMTPSVLVLDDDNIGLVKHETFGNVLPVSIVRNLDEAIARANNTMYGLSNVVFTANLERAGSIAERLQSGMVFINDPLLIGAGWDNWTGWKSSGFGTTEPKLMQCLRKKVTSINRSQSKRVFWYPYPDPNDKDSET